MKVSRTARRLRLRSQAWQTWWVSLVCFGAGAMGWLLLAQTSELRCDRSLTSQCQLTHRRPRQTTTHQFSIASLREATLDIDFDDGDTLYRVLLVTDEETLPLSSLYTSNGGGQRRRVNQINQFLQTPTDPSLRLRQDTRWLGLVFLGAFGFGGLLLLLSNRTIDCTFDKDTNQFSLRLWGLRGATTHQHPLSNLLGMRVEQSTDKDTDTSRLTVVLKTGEAIPLSIVYTGTFEAHASLARQVQEFLRLPPLTPWNSSSMTAAQAKLALDLMVGGQAKRQATMADCRARLRHDPFHLESHQGLASALVMEGQKDEAKRLVETARAQAQRLGESTVAAQLDHLLELLKLKPY